MATRDVATSQTGERTPDVKPPARAQKMTPMLAQYLSVVLAEGDAGELADALGHIAKARGMAQIAKDSGLGREALYKALRPGAHPRFDTVNRVCEALGVRLVAVPKGAVAQPRQG